MSALLSRRERINFALDRLQKGFLSEILCAARARVMNQALSPQYTTHRLYDSTDKPKKKNVQRHAGRGQADLLEA